MSILSPLEIRTQLGSALGKGGLPYWNKLRDFLTGKLGRAEFEELIRQYINTPELVNLHNSLIYSILWKASQPAISANASAPVQGPPRKKRKLLPHQDPPSLLSRWVTGIGRAERARLKGSVGRRPVPIKREYSDEILTDRPVKTLAEGTSRPGTHVALALGTLTRTLPTLQQLSGRIDLIAAQHQMTVTKTTALLLSNALEAYLKQITGHALAATASALSFSSISPAEPSAQPSLTAASFSTLHSIAPFEVPMPTAAVTKTIMMRETAAYVEDYEDEDDLFRITQNLDPTNRQIVRTLFAHSGVREMVRSLGKGTRRLAIAP